MTAFALLGGACGDDDALPDTTTATTATTTTTTEPGSTTTTAATTTTTSLEQSTTTTTLPPVEGPEPSERVVAFYYPWYGNPDFDGGWVHWDQSGATPPADIGSDYYPVLGPYSAVDPAVVAQHFAWLRQAGVGVIATSWWGRGSTEDRAVPVLLDAAERYGIAVAFHIEPYAGRTADGVVQDITYLYDRYGDHAAFFRSSARTRWSNDDRPKGLFFVWSSSVPHDGAGVVGPEYWRDAMDLVHTLPEGGLVIANTPSGSWVDGGHFDGLYNYATLDTSPGFDWARTLPPDAWYIPSLVPGFSAQRIGYDPGTFTARDDGATYEQQWAAALDTGIEPAMVSITSFNEWHEGTQIEPAEPGAMRNESNAYDDYGDLGSDGYLDLTRALAADYLAMDWAAVMAPRIRIRMTTTSDWTALTLESGGEWIQPVAISLTDTATWAFEGAAGERLALLQPLDEAEAGRPVELVLEVGVFDPKDPMRFRIERGGLGYTRVEVTGLDGTVETGSAIALWDGWSDELIDAEARNPFWFVVTAAELGR
jgi:hypothetical protein